MASSIASKAVNCAQTSIDPVKYSMDTLICINLAILAFLVFSLKLNIQNVPYNGNGSRKKTFAKCPSFSESRENIRVYPNLRARAT